MLTSREEDAVAVLEALYEWAEAEDDPKVGTYRVSGLQLQERLGFSPNRINGAVELLVLQGHVERLQGVDTQPFDFSQVWPVIEGA